MPRTRDVPSCPDQYTHRRLLLIQLSSSRDGSALSGLQLLDSFKQAGWETHVFFGHDGPMVGTYADQGHATRIHAHKNWLRQPMPWQLLRNRRHAQIDGRNMLARMRSLAPTLVYVNSGASYAGAWAAKKLGIPAVWHVRELMSDEGGELIAPWGFKESVRRAFCTMTQARVANSRYVAKAIFGADQDVRVIHNAVDNAYFEPRQAPAEARTHLGIPVDSSVVGIPGTLRPVKGHAFAMRALAPWILAAGHRRLLISGDTRSAHASAVLELSSALGIRHRTDFVGSLPDMRVFYDACDIALVASASESFGRVAAEAMARGIPLVSTRSGALPEIVRDQLTGLTVDYGDESALAQAVETLHQDRLLSQQLVERAHKDVRTRFTASTYSRETQRVAEDVLAQTCAGGSS